MKFRISYVPLRLVEQAAQGSISYDRLAKADPRPFTGGDEHFSTFDGAREAALQKVPFAYGGEVFIAHDKSGKVWSVTKGGVQRI